MPGSTDPRDEMLFVEGAVFVVERIEWPPRIHGRQPLPRLELRFGEPGGAIVRIYVELIDQVLEPHLPRPADEATSRAAPP